jgi:hypothetical protein
MIPVKMAENNVRGKPPYLYDLFADDLAHRNLNRVRCLTITKKPQRR